jgi:diacylglycerol kinase family enzyme
LFANAGKRGFLTYMKIVSREFKNYQTSNYKIIADGNEININAFLVTVANANQYGNNVYIAPNADTTDGLMNVVILKPFGLIHAPTLAGRLFFKNMHKAALVETFKAKEVDIIRMKSGPIHYDGEPSIMGSELKFRILPESLRIIVP